jgi:PAS domain S-box-containing protein
MTPKLDDNDSQAVYQCLRDIVAFSTMPAMWSGADPVRIAESLAAALYTTLDPQFVYVCFTDGHRPLVSIAQVDRYETSSTLAQQIGSRILDRARSHDPEDILFLPNPRGAGTLRLTTRAVGHHAEQGVIAAAFADERSPTSIHHLILNVAASQAAIAIQNAHLLRSLRDSEQQFANIFNQTTAGIAQTDLSGRFVRVNDRYCQIVGRSGEELLKLRMQDITHPDDVPRSLDNFQAVVEGRVDSFVIEERCLRPNGSEVWVHNDVSAIRDSSGKIHSIAAAVIDITERRQAEQERAAMLAREVAARTEAELLNEAARTLTGELDLQALVQSVTHVATKVTGAKFGAFFYNVTDEQGQSYVLYTVSGAPRQAFDKFGLPRNSPLFDSTFQGHGPVRVDDVLKDPRYGKNPPHHGMPEGHLPVRSYLAVPVASRSGEVLGGIFFGHPEAGVFTERAERLSIGIAAQAAVAIDNACLFAKAEKEIAARKQAEKVLRESEEFNRSIVESSRDCIQVLDVEGRLLSMTRPGQEMLCIDDIQPYLNKPYIELWQHDRPGAVAALKAAAAGQSGRFVGFCPTLRGEPKWWDVVISPIFDAAGRPERLLADARDVTEQKRAEDDRWRAERYLATQYAITRVLAETASLRDATPRILQAVCESAEWKLGALWTVDEVGDVLRCVDTWHVPGTAVEEFESITRQSSFKPSVGLPGRVWSSGKPAWIADVVEDTNFPRSPYAAQVGLHGAFAFPIRIREHITGVIEFFSHEVRQPDDQLLRLFESVGEQIGQFILRRSAEDARAQLAAVVDSSDDAIVSKTLDGIITSWNRAAERIFGYSAAEAVGQHITLIVPADRRAEEEEVLRRLRRGERIEHFDTERQAKDGRILSISLTVSPVKNAEGHIIGASKVARDITERRRAEKALQESEERYRRLVALLPAAVYTCEPSGMITFFNDRAAELWGRAPKQGDTDDRFCGSFKLWWPDGRPLPHNETPMAIALREGRELRNQEVVIERPDGSRITVLVNIDPIRDGNGELAGAISVFHDTTALKQAQETVAQSEERFRTLVSVITDVPWTTNAAGQFITPQPAWEANTGQSWEQLKNFGWIEALHPEDREQTWAAWQRANEYRTVYESHGRLWHAASQQYRYFESRASPILNSDGSVREWVGACTNVHERKQTEALVISQKQALEMAASGAPLVQILEFLARAVENYSERAIVAIHLLDEHGTRFERTAAPSLPSEYVRVTEGMDVSSATGPCCVAVTSRRRVAVAEGFPAFTAFAAPLEIHSGWSLPIFSSTGKVLGTVAYYYREVRDPHPQDELSSEIVTRTASIIIEGKRAEAEREALLAAAQAARAEAEQANRLKDEFLAVVSHELRTPLSAVLGWASMLRVGHLDTEKARLALEAIERNARAQSQLIDDLLDVARIITGKLRLDVRPINPCASIEGAIESLRPAADARQVVVQKVLDADTGAVSGDFDRLQQVVWNLLSNAIKFTPPGGRVEVRLERVQSHINIVVSDTGMGINQDFLPFVFDRFRQADAKTTRAHGGLGLGLAIVRHLVELHGGEVRAESEGEGRGAKFTVSLPRMPVFRRESHDRLQPAANEFLRQIEWPDRLHGVRVLVIDDEPDTCELVRTMLVACGAEVITAISAKVALDQIERSQFDLIVSDIGMPGTDGYELMRAVRRLPPERGGRTPAIALTAYSTAEDRLRALRAGYQMHVPKPIEYAELITVMASLADRQKQTG